MGGEIKQMSCLLRTKVMKNKKQNMVAMQMSNFHSDCCSDILKIQNKNKFTNFGGDLNENENNELMI